MNGPGSTRALLLLLCSTLLNLGTARADALHYTVTDLGAGVIEPTKAADGNWVVTSADGSASYAYAPVDNSLADPSAIVNALPPFHNAPVWASMTYGDPRNAFSTTRGPAFLNDHGIFVSTNVYGVAGHSQAAGSDVYASRRQPDGSFSAPTAIWGSSANDYTGGQVATALGLNNRDQVLGVTSADPFSPGARRFLLADLTKGSVTDLQTLVPDSNLSWQPSLDGEGRLLVIAASKATNWREDHTLLLTPDGLSSAPLPVPEPTTLATLVVALGGMAAHRRRAGVPAELE